MSSSVYRIEKTVSGGLGLARSEAEGVVLIPGALEGELVEVDPSTARGVHRGPPTQILEASRDRVLYPAPDLPTLDFAHARIEAQLRCKREWVQEALVRIAKMPEAAALVQPTAESPAEWGYRASAQYLVTASGLAYRGRRSHAPRTLNGRDPLMLEFINDFLEKVDANIEALSGVSEITLRGSAFTEEVAVALVGVETPEAARRAADALMQCGAAGVLQSGRAARHPSQGRFSSGVSVLAGSEHIAERFGEARLWVSPAGFAQVNPAAAAEAYKVAAEWAGEGDHAADVFGGAGAIAQHLLPRYRKITIIDTSKEALARGQASAERWREQDASRLRWLRGSTELLPELSAETLLLDPPRAGLSREALAHLGDSMADRIVYMSCDSGTWARDVAALAAGGWKLKRVQPFDFYPQTSHTEVLSLLER